MESEFLKAPEIAARLGVGRLRVYQLISSGEIPSVRIGGAIRIPREAWERWVGEKVAEAMSAESLRGSGQ